MLPLASAATDVAALPPAAPIALSSSTYGSVHAARADGSATTHSASTTKTRIIDFMMVLFMVVLQLLHKRELAGLGFMAEANFDEINTRADGRAVGSEAVPLHRIRTLTARLVLDELGHKSAGGIVDAHVHVSARGHVVMNRRA